jgi:hypothetical protein
MRVSALVALGPWAFVFALLIVTVLMLALTVIVRFAKSDMVVRVRWLGFYAERGKADRTPPSIAKSKPPPALRSVDKPDTGPGSAVRSG